MSDFSLAVTVPTSLIRCSGLVSRLHHKEPFDAITSCAASETAPTVMKFHHCCISHVDKPTFCYILSLACYGCLFTVSEMLFRYVYTFIHLSLDQGVFLWLNKRYCSVMSVSVVENVDKTLHQSPQSFMTQCIHLTQMSR